MILKKALQEADWEKAISCLTIYLNHSAGQSQPEIDKARALYARVHLQMAEERLQAAQSDSMPLSKGVIKHAISDCETALQQCPDFTPAAQRLVQLLYEKGDKRGAEKQARKLFAIAPDEQVLPFCVM